MISDRSAYHSLQCTLLTCKMSRDVDSWYFEHWCMVYTRGRYRMTEKKFELITQARKQPKSWDRWHFFLLIGTFWYLSSIKLHYYSEIIHICSLWRWKTVEICNKHWNLRRKPRPVLFCKYLLNESSDLYEIKT